MDQHCPECGAPLAPGESCQEFFERLLFEEYADMERNGPVHPQMVASFMLTHDRYSDEARPQAIALLRIALEDQRRRSTCGACGAAFRLDTPHKPRSAWGPRRALSPGRSPCALGRCARRGLSGAHQPLGALRAGHARRAGG